MKIDKHAALRLLQVCPARIASQLPPSNVKSLVVLFYNEAAVLSWKFWCNQLRMSCLHAPAAVGLAPPRTDNMSGFRGDCE
jgi:hypothetical protein